MAGAGTDRARILDNAVAHPAYKPADGNGTSHTPDCRSPDFAAVIDAVVAEILEHLAPLKLSFIGNIRQLLPQALFFFSITRIKTLSVSSS